ncbi:protease synthase and sporulation negative regulatory protein pai 1 [Companilactobacillus nantensis DSM 16982]|uniref:Protease synthase and sporulation negative regulatory protein pai 1 n=1 Tax=Companilactobacillus nantensis DSM 16982 TaxID=1423774 RepID=A0A0R1WAH3_9LACO|nr:protease synthase and sporulation negative regulatory protein pai 1 [Companilactobacillus nantensis DSM 16982]
MSAETYLATFGQYNTPENTQAYIHDAYALDVLRREMTNKNSEFYFLFVDQELAGYLKVNILDAQSEPLDDSFMEIQRIYIRVPFKRMGLGKVLMEFAIERAKAFKKPHVWLGVWEKNFPAQKFYQSMGFEHYSSHKFVMGTSTQTDYILKKELEK